MPDSILYNDQLGPIAASNLQVTPAGASASVALSSIMNGGSVAQTGVFANVVSNTASAAATLTAGSMTGGSVLNTILLTGSLAAGAALTLPTATGYITALSQPNLNNGNVVRFVNQSAGAFSWTITSNGSFVTAGSSVVAQGNWREYNVIVQNSTSVVATDIGGGSLT